MEKKAMSNVTRNDPKTGKKSAASCTTRKHKKIRKHTSCNIILNMIIKMTNAVFWTFFHSLVMWT